MSEQKRFHHRVALTILPRKIKSFLIGRFQYTSLHNTVTFLTGFYENKYSPKEAIPKKDYYIVLILLNFNLPSDV